MQGEDKVGSGAGRKGRRGRLAEGGPVACTYSARHDVMKLSAGSTSAKKAHAVEL